MAVKFIHVIAISLLFKLSQEEVNEPPQPKIILHSGWTEVFSGEKVTLKCEIPNANLELTYVWRRNSKQLSSEDGVSENGRSLLISSINPSHKGNYVCITEVKERPQTRVESVAFSLTVHEKPTLLLNYYPEYEVFYPGEHVKLTCNVRESSDGWEYHWYKIPDESKVLNSNTRDSSFNINSVELSHNGMYLCEVKRDGVKFKSTNYPLTIVERPQPKIILHSGWKVVFSGEKVTLKCEIPNANLELIYVWHRNSKELSSEDGVFENGRSLLVSSINLNHAGNYVCITEVKERPQTKAGSAPFLLMVYGKPTLLLNHYPEYKVFYPGEHVKLTCKVQEKSSGWEYYWYKIPDESRVLNSNTRDSSFIINSAELSHNGMYLCVVKRESVRFKSTNYPIAIVEPPQPKIILHSGWTEVFSGEKVALKCEIPNANLELIYVWHRNSKQLSSEDGVSENGRSLLVSSINPSHKGNYVCITKVKERPQTRVESVAFSLTVHEKLTLLLNHYPDYKVFYPGEHVKLTCNVRESSAGWEYHWYKIPDESKVLNSNTRDSSFIINSAELSHNGMYLCEVKRDGVKFKSTNYQLTIDKPPQPNIILHSGWKEVFSGEKVTLKCEIPNANLELIYVWHSNSKQLSSEDGVLENGRTLLISSINPSHRGNYVCKTEVKQRPQTKAGSSPFLLMVYEEPTLLLNQHPQYKVFYPGEHVKLTCNVQESSSGWEYYWYKIPDESEVLNSNTRDSSFIINSAELSHNGMYLCEVKRESVRFKSQNYQLTIEKPPQPKISLHSGWKEVFPDEEVTLKCEIPNANLEFTYVWLRNSKQLPSEDGVLENGRSLLISSINPSHGGDYVCKTEVKERPQTRAESMAFSLTVHARPSTSLILETSWSDIMSVDSLTLKCKVDDARSWNYTWYKDGLFQDTSTEQRYSVKATEETFKSEYKCQGNRTERPLYSAISDGFKANNIVLKRKVLLSISGCVVCSLVLLIIGCIALRFTRKPEKKEPVKEDLFFSMTDYKTQTSSPLQDYMMENEPALKMEGCDQTAVLLVAAVSTADLEDQIKIDQPNDMGGLKSFKEA